MPDEAIEAVSDAQRWSPVRGILVGMCLVVPFWAAVALGVALA